MKVAISLSLALLFSVQTASGQSAAPSPSAPACALLEPKGPRAIGLGTIIGIQAAAASRAGISAREKQRGGAIDSHYLNNLRVVVRQDSGIVDTFDVSAGMTIHVGDRVGLQGSYRSTASTCSYIPHMVIPNDAPVA